MPPSPQTCRRALLLCWAMAACTGALAQSAAAPAAPVTETRQMIEALKPPLQRGMRNLLVRQTAEPAAAASAATGPVATVAPAAPLQASAPAMSQPAATAPPATTAQTAPAGPDLAAPPSLSLAIQFDTNSARVRPESGAVLGNLVAAMLSPDLKGSRFMIEGHTDASGQAANNQRLSLLRAEEVRLYLVALGVHPGRLRAVGKGASEPINPADPRAADNRRVRVVTLE